MTRIEARLVVGELLAGRATEAQAGGFLMALAAKGETTEELLGMREAMFEVSAPLVLPPDATDIVGIGGSARRRVSAFNVSTIACIVASAAGATICKHGNRKASSTSGSFDLLEALGVNIEASPKVIESGVHSVGLGFAFARAHHPAMRHVGPTRTQLGVPTVFNVLGPLAHPGKVKRQVIGVADERRARQAVDVIAGTDAVHVWIVHGHENLDELALSGPSQVTEVHNGEINSFVVSPGDVGLQTVPGEAVLGGDAQANAELTRSVLGGEPSPNRDMVVLNAAAGLVVAGIAGDLGGGVEAATAAIDDGRALAKLAALVAHTNS